MKIAIVHDWLVAPGGAEQVLSRLLKLFPQADLFTVVDHYGEALREDTLQGKRARTSFIQKLPLSKRLYRAYLPFMPMAMAGLDLRGYDLILSSSHAVAKGVTVHPYQVHICYCHTPMRYAWDRRYEYLQYLQQLPTIPGLRFLALWQMEKLRAWDCITAASVDHFIANSHYVARRIALSYRRSAQVIYPPVEVDKWIPTQPVRRDDYYVTWGRLVKQKHIDRIVEAFAHHLPDRRLLVIGDGPLYQKLARLKARNVTLTGRLPHSELVQIVQRARAYVHAAVDDFGIAPIEALAAGVPVIAYGEGGVCETVGNAGDVGLLYRDRSAEGIAAAIRAFERRADIDGQKCIERARQFSCERFDQAILSLVDQQMNQKTRISFNYE